MPELVRKDGTWNDVRVGDIVGPSVQDDMKIAVIDKKQKFAFVTFSVTDQIRPYRKGLGDAVTYWREQATDAEKEERRKQFIHTMLRDDLLALLSRSPMKKLEQIMEKARHASGDGDLAYDVLTWTTLPDVLETQARYKVAVRIRSYLDAERVEDATYDDLLTAHAKWWLIERENALNGYPSSPLSRSTNVISNLLEDLNDWAVRDFSQKFGFASARAAIEARADEIVAERK